jgi:hypothetical protein
MTVLLTNNVSTTLAASIAAGDATFNVVDGNRFPSPTTGQYAYATIIAPNGAVEIVKITSRIGNALGVVRGQDGTSAQVFPAGSRVELRVTAGSILDAVADGVAEFDADIAALDLRLDTAEAELISLDGRLDTAESDITALEGRMTTAEGDITSLEGRMTTAEGDIVALENFDTALATSTGSTSVGFLQAGTSATLRTVQSKLRDFVSVKDFGAVGDNSADDTTKIQAALTYALSSGKSLYIPSGTYIVSSLSGAGALNITAGIQIFGDGNSSVLKLKAGSTGVVVYAYNASAYSGLHLRDFVVDGNSVTTAQLDAGLIQILNASDFVVDNVTVKNGTRASGSAGINGIAVADTASNATNGIIQNCLVENCSKALINWTTNARNGLIQNCVLRSASGNGLAPGLQINGGQNVKVIANHIYGNQGSGVLIATDGAGVAPQFPIIIGNHIYGNGIGTSEGAGIKLARAFGSAFGRVIIANNHIYENGVNVNDSGIVLVDDANVIIQGNYVYKNKLAAIAIGGTTSSFRDVFISGNVFEDNNQANISSVGAIYSVGTISNVVIKNNRFVDTQTPSTTHYPIYTASGTFTNWRVSGNTFINYRNPQIVFFDTTTPAVWSASAFTITGTLQTTTASAIYVAIVPVADNTACVLRISSLAVQSGGSNRAYYDKENAMYRAGGALTALGAVVTYYEQESDATWGGAGPTQTSNFALASIAGKAATTIDWSYTYRMEWK